MSVVYKSFEDEFSKVLINLQEDMLTAIGNRQASDFAEYSRICGRLQGLKDAHNIFMQIVDKRLGELE